MVLYCLTRRCGGETHTRTTYHATLRDARRAEQKWLDEIVDRKGSGVRYHDLDALSWDHSEITKITKREAVELLNTGERA